MNNKLKVLLLSLLSSTHEDETNCRIASYILENIDEVREMNIVELARVCFVSNSSVSRFCREIGLRDFSELRQLMEPTTNSYHIIGKTSDFQLNTTQYIEQVEEGIRLVKEGIDYEKVERIVDDLMNYQRIAAFGMLNAESVAMGLQNDMLLFRKMITTKVSFQQQNDFLERTDRDDLIIIFSSMGMFFHPYIRQIRFDKNNKPRIILITSNGAMKPDDLFDEVLVYKTVEYEASSPFQLELIKGIIVQNYAMRMKDKMD